MITRGTFGEGSFMSRGSPSGEHPGQMVSDLMGQRMDCHDVEGVVYSARVKSLQWNDAT